MEMLIRVYQFVWFLIKIWIASVICTKIENIHNIHLNKMKFKIMVVKLKMISFFCLKLEDKSFWIKKKIHIWFFEWICCWINKCIIFCFFPLICFENLFLTNYTFTAWAVFLHYNCKTWLILIKSIWLSN